MAPLKRGFDLISDDVLDYDFMGDNMEVSLIDSFCTPMTTTTSKKLKSTTSTSPKGQMKNDLSSYLDFSSEYDAVVPSASDLVNKSEAWLSDSIPGSPVSVFHELPDSDSDSDVKPSLFEFEDLSSKDDNVFHTDDFGDLDVPLLGGDITDCSLAANQLLLGVIEMTPPVDTKINIKTPMTVTIPAIPKEKTISTQPKKQVIHTAQATMPLTTNQPTTATRMTYDTTTTNTAPTFTPAMTEESKSISSRWAHNSTERKRRCEIRRLFSGLRDLFPDLHGDDRTSNINTLNRAISCVAELARKQVEQEAAIRVLRERNAMLKARKMKNQRSRMASVINTTSSSTVTVQSTPAIPVSSTPSIPISAPTQVNVTPSVPVLNIPVPTIPSIPSIPSTQSSVAPKPNVNVTTPLKTVISSPVVSTSVDITSGSTIKTSISQTHVSTNIPNFPVQPIAQSPSVSTPVVKTPPISVSCSTSSAPTCVGSIATVPSATVAPIIPTPNRKTLADSAHRTASAKVTVVPTTVTTPALSGSTSAEPTINETFKVTLRIPNPSTPIATPAKSTAIPVVPRKPVAAVPEIEAIYPLDGITSIEAPHVRRALPSALRQLLDHNGRGAQEAQPLPPRRKVVRKF